MQSSYQVLHTTQWPCRGSRDPSFFVGKCYNRTSEPVMQPPWAAMWDEPPLPMGYLKFLSALAYIRGSLWGEVYGTGFSSPDPIMQYELDMWARIYGGNGCRSRAETGHFLSLNTLAILKLPQSSKRSVYWVLSELVFSIQFNTRRSNSKINIRPI